MEKSYNLKNDIIFKAFFSRKGNEEYLIDFLNALLGIEIEKIVIKDEVNLEQLASTEKGGRLDLQATLNERQIVNIELQSKDRGNFRVRTVFYASKIISREVVRGTDYNDVEKTILINILGYEMFPQYDDYVSKTSIVLRNHRECEVMDDIEWWFIELPKFRKAHPNMNEKINQWLAFIDDEDKELVELAEKKNKVLKKARNEVNYLTGNAEMRRLAELREKWDLEFEMSMEHAKKQGEELGRMIGEENGKTEGEKIGRAEGEKIGRVEGEKIGRVEGEKIGKEIGQKNAKIEMAKKLLVKGMKIEEIMEITDLERKEIENIK